MVKKKKHQEEIDLWYHRGTNCGWNDAYKEMRQWLKEHPKANYEDMVDFCAGKVRAM